MGFDQDGHSLDLFDVLYGRSDANTTKAAPRHYGDDMASELTQDAIPDRHGYRHHLATGCRCGVCVAGCEAERAKGPNEHAGHGKPKPWSRPRPDIETAQTHEEWKAAQSA